MGKCNNCKGIIDSSAPFRIHINIVILYFGHEAIKDSDLIFCCTECLKYYMERKANEIIKKGGS